MFRTDDWNGPLITTTQVKESQNPLKKRRGKLPKLDLTPAEIQVLQRMANGEKYQDIHRWDSKTRHYLMAAYRKLGAVSGAHAIALAFRKGLIK